MHAKVFSRVLLWLCFFVSIDLDAKAEDAQGLPDVNVQFVLVRIGHGERTDGSAHLEVKKLRSRTRNEDGDIVTVTSNLLYAFDVPYVRYFTGDGRSQECNSKLEKRLATWQHAILLNEHSHKSSYLKSILRNDVLVICVGDTPAMRRSF